VTGCRTCVLLRDRCRNTIALNVHVPKEDKTDDMDSFYEEAERVFDKLPKYHMEI
jgi:hypothetical protein